MVTEDTLVMVYGFGLILGYILKTCLDLYWEEKRNEKKNK